jgi:hypothetical protein
MTQTKQHNTSRFGLLLSALFLITLLLQPLAASAAATIGLSSSGAATRGGIVTVGIYENSGGDAVNAASVTLSYPANLLTYTGVSNSGAFNIAAATSGGGGKVFLERGALSPVAGRQLIATVSFRAAAVGSAAVTVSGGSILSATTNGELFGGGSGTTIAIREPVAAAPAKPAPPPPPKDTTPPSITDVKVSDIGPYAATVTWKTSEPANSKVDYGFTDKYGVTASDGAMVTDHKVVLNSAVLSPALGIHALVSSTDGAGNTASGKDITFSTKGLNVAVTVLDKQKRPVKNAVIRVGDKSFTTNEKGVAVVSDLHPGKSTAVVDYKGRQTAMTIDVQPYPDVANMQKASTTIETSRSFAYAPFLVILLVVLAALALRLHVSRAAMASAVTGIQARFSHKETPAQPLHTDVTYSGATPQPPIAGVAPPVPAKPGEVIQANSENEQRPKV